MDWRGKLNQQAVTGGSKYSSGTVSSLRRRDLESQYEQAVTNNYSKPTSTGGMGTEYQSQAESGAVEQQPITGSQIAPPPTSFSPTPSGAQKPSENNINSLRDSVRNYQDASSKAREAKELAKEIKLGGSALAFATGNPVAGILGFLGTAAGDVFGGDQDFDKRMDVENTGKALSLYDLYNTEGFTGYDQRGNPVPQEDRAGYLTSTLRDFYSTGLGTMTDEQRSELLKKLGLTSSQFGTELGFDVPDLASPEFGNWARGQAVRPGWNYSPEDFGVYGGV